MAPQGLQYADADTDASSRASPEDQLRPPRARSPSLSTIAGSMRQKLKALRKKIVQGQTLVPAAEPDGSGNDRSQYLLSSTGLVEPDVMALRFPLLSSRHQGSWDESRIIFNRNRNFLTSSRDKMVSPDRLCTNFQHAIMPRKWPDEELELQREVIKKYEAGVRLWTKEELLAMEDMATGLGGKVCTPLYAGQGEYTVEKEKGYLYKVDFHGYKALAFPLSSRANGTPYSSMTLSKKPAYTHIPTDLDEQEDVFHRWWTIWDTSSIGRHFHACMMRLPFPPYINKIVCIGLGNFVAASADADANANLPTPLQHAILRHAAVLTVADALDRRFGREIRVLAQDPEYTPDCAAVLARRGFAIVGRHGAAGLAEIDDKTFVFAPSPGFCVKEVVADIATPAGMFWGMITTPEEERDRERGKTNGPGVDFGAGVMGYWNPDNTDPDTPRVRLLGNQYGMHPFPYTNLFGDVAIYSLRG
ncbi:uncharacterized protein F4812DRAFT_462232 [Daldinia caldariorum]|uniref:uncharacterized protein n=1 Tax=Daldinia caldariorum TaxID=326644 RepID=UPI002008749E|nr:uncharacterized protein F4812DRAFT_462232 [Daldinia caldariorum]KAI1464909.1 hypothetical protein F4812DRAFT_462232 [Daldinia caldariorum]